MYTLINNDGQYLYKTYRGDFIFSNSTNMLFDTEEQATNWLHYNSFRFKNESVTVLNLLENKNKRVYDYNGFLNSINETFKNDITEYHGLIEGDVNIPDIPILVKQHIPIYDKETIPQEKAQWTHEDSVREAKDLLKSVSAPFFDDIEQSKTKERNDYIDSLADEELIRLVTLVENSITSSLANNSDCPPDEEEE